MALTTTKTSSSTPSQTPPQTLPLQSIPQPNYNAAKTLRHPPSQSSSAKDPLTILHKTGYFLTSTPLSPPRLQLQRGPHSHCQTCTTQPGPCNATKVPDSTASPSKPTSHYGRSLAKYSPTPSMPAIKPLPAAYHRANGHLTTHSFPKPPHPRTPAADARSLA